MTDPGFAPKLIVAIHAGMAWPAAARVIRLRQRNTMPIVRRIRTMRPRGGSYAESGESHGVPANYHNADVAAAQTESEMDPTLSKLQALLASKSVGRYGIGQVTTGHGQPPKGRTPAVLLQ